MNIVDARTSTRLRQWAAGRPPAQAAVELVLRAFRGRFADPGLPWVRVDGDVTWLDPDTLRDHAAVLSGGERRLLFVVASLLDERPLDIVDVATGLDRENLQLVLAALAHAGGSHSSTVLEHVDGAVRFSSPGPLVPWPDSEGPGRSS
ncbi:ABC transporter ATP-binding protein [Actinotalea sp. AC32]|nr:ABC transporter ATP-binding protein [Actinotalea sp. AC32]